MIVLCFRPSAAPPARQIELWLVDGAGHVQIPAVYPEMLEARTVGFFREAPDGWMQEVRASAARLGLPLVTADARLAAAMPGSVCEVRLLGARE